MERPECNESVESRLREDLISSGCPNDFFLRVRKVLANRGHRARIIPQLDYS